MTRDEDEGLYQKGNTIKEKKREDLNKRVETMGIVEDSDIQQEIKEILDLYLKDNVKAKILQSDGSYKLNNIKENEKRVNAQEELVQFTHNKNKNLEKEFSQTIIIPMVK